MHRSPRRKNSPNAVVRSASAMPRRRRAPDAEHADPAQSPSRFQSARLALTISSPSSATQQSDGSWPFRPKVRRALLERAPAVPQWSAGSSSVSWTGAPRLDGTCGSRFRRGGARPAPRRGRSPCARSGAAAARSAEISSASPGPCTSSATADLFRCGCACCVVSIRS